MITLSNRHSFEYMVASGALAFDGQGWFWERPLVWLGLVKPELFTVVIKSLTLKPRRGNLRWWKPWTCVRTIPGGAVNKVGLTNPGIEWWCRRVGPTLDYKRFPIVGSIFGEENELVEMAGMLNRFKLVGLEVNVSCPNSGHPMEAVEKVVTSVKAVRRFSRHPIIVKVSVDQRYLDIAAGLAGIAEAISLNSVPWSTAFPNGERSPLWRLEKKLGGGGGGVSGKPAQQNNWHAVAALAQQGLIPVIGPSIMEFEDMDIVRRWGAKVVSFGAIHLRTPLETDSVRHKGKPAVERSVPQQPLRRLSEGFFLLGVIVSFGCSIISETVSMNKKINPKSPEGESELKVPADLHKALAAASATEAVWRDLTPIARRDFITWIESAKLPETRKRRIGRVAPMLASGKRRPCCYAIVPMNFYKALGGTPRAKAQWKILTPNERRDFVGWVESVKEPEARRQRVEKACLALATGKRRP